MNRRMTGRVNQLNGLAAEDQVLTRYLSLGFELVARRWTGLAGEIDLILRKGAEIVFVEVKRAKTLALAAHRLSGRQIARIFAAGEEFLGTLPSGALTPARVDFAMVDGQGRQDVIENIMPN